MELLRRGWVAAAVGLAGVGHGQRDSVAYTPGQSRGREPRSMSRSEERMIAMTGHRVEASA